MARLCCVGGSPTRHGEIILAVAPAVAAAERNIAGILGGGASFTYSRRQSDALIARWMFPLMTNRLLPRFSCGLAPAVRIAAVIALLFGAIRSGYAAESGLKKFDLPADSAEKSLKRLSQQSGFEILFATEMTAGVRTSPVKGEYSVVEAANRALANTGLIAVQDARSRTLTINRSARPRDRTTRSDGSGADAELAKKK